MRREVIDLFARLLLALITFAIYSLIHDVIIKIIYCKWKKQHNNGYRCYFWTCKHWHTCSYNGSKRRFSNIFSRRKSAVLYRVCAGYLGDPQIYVCEPLAPFTSIYKASEFAEVLRDSLPADSDRVYFVLAYYPGQDSYIDKLPPLRRF